MNPPELNQAALEKAREMLATPVTRPPDLYLSTRAMVAIRAGAEPVDLPFCIAMMTVHEMPDQKADAWAISDPEVSAGYRAGQIDEHTLALMATQPKQAGEGFQDQ